MFLLFPIEPVAEDLFVLATRNIQYIECCIKIPLSYTCRKCLKGQIFCFWFVSWISLPPAPEYSIKTVSNFFEKNSQRYSQLKVCRRWQIFAFSSLSGVCSLILFPLFATGVNNTRGTGGKICRQCRWYRWQICRRCRWYRRQFATGVVDTGGAHWLANISANFQGLGRRWFMKKTWSKKSRDTVPLNYQHLKFLTNTSIILNLIKRYK